MPRITNLLLVAGCLLPVSCSPDPVPPAPVEWRGIETAVRDLIEGAIADVQQDLRSASAWETLAFAYHANDLIDLAAPCYDRVLELEPRNARGWYLLGRLRVELGDEAGALEAVNRAAEIETARGFIRWRRGFWQLRQGRLDAAEADFEAARTLDPADPVPSIGLARVAAQKGEAARVVAILEPLVETRVPNPDFVNQLLARAYRQLGRLDDARAIAPREARRSLSWADPWSDELYSHRRLESWSLPRAEQLVREGKAAEAVAILRPLAGQHPDDPALWKVLGRAHFAAGEPAEAIECLTHVVQLTPGDFSAQLNLGFAYEQSGDWTRAMRHTRQALAINPKSVEAKEQGERILEQRLKEKRP